MSNDLTKEAQVLAIARGAELMIKTVVGMDVTLVVKYHVEQPHAEALEMLGEVAKALGKTMDDYYGPRTPPNVNLRCIGSVLMKRYYPHMKLQQVAEVLNDSLDHSMILAYHKRHKEYLMAEGNDYGCLYDRAEEAVKEWLKTKKAFFERGKEVADGK